MSRQARFSLLIAAAVLVGAVGAGAAWLLLRMIGFVTNVLYDHRIAFDFVEVNAAPFASSPWTILILTASALAAGLAIRYGHLALRGHGIPEVMESVLERGSRIPPRVALLKPVFAALVIGSGGPFGAEGPIIQTSGALGSLLGQLPPFTEVERKVLIACGAAAGMTGIFGTPVAAVLLPVELIVFEFSLRAIAPTAVAAGVAAVLRGYLLGVQPLFPLASTGRIGGLELLWCIVFGVLAGFEAAGITWALYRVEDLYARIPRTGLVLQPAIGALIVGLIALLGPEALGVGYDLIRQVLNDHLSLVDLVRIFGLKTVSWVVALSSGTVGGVLAPLFLIGGASGAIVGRLLHGVTGMAPGLVALVFMAAVFGASGRIVLTASIFAVEVTGDFQAIVPALVATAVATAMADRLLPYNVMTGKLIRRGARFSLDYFAAAQHRDVQAHASPPRPDRDDR